jgi:hypothetical protein
MAVLPHKFKGFTQIIENDVLSVSDYGDYVNTLL